MATIVRYVNTDSTAGGDGTTNATTGANRAYPTLNDAEIALRQDLTDGGGDILEIRCSAPGGVADTAKVSFAQGGWTTNDSSYVHVISDDDHGGKWDDTKYRLVNGSGGAIITTHNQTVYLTGLQIRNTVTNNDCTAVSASRENATFVFRRLICRGPASANTSGNTRGIYVADGHCRLVNSVAYGWRHDGGGGRGISAGVGGNNNVLVVYNCTAYDCDIGFAGEATIKAVNCLAAGCADGFGTTFQGTSDYNASDLASDAPGSNSRNSQTFSFVNAGAGDFHLTSGDTGAKDYGTSLAADATYAFSTDIDGQTRTGTWDIGADEVVVAGATFYFKNEVVAGGPQFGVLQLEGTRPTTATTTTGWTVASVTNDYYSLLEFNTERASGTFGAAAQPSSGPNSGLGDGFRTDQMSGTFDAGDWTVKVPVIAVSSGGTQDGRMYVRVWKSANTNMSSPTELTSGAVALSVVTNLTTSTPQISQGTVSLPQFTLSNEYLMFQFAWQHTGS